MSAAAPECRTAAPLTAPPAVARLAPPFGAPKPR